VTFKPLERYETSTGGRYPEATMEFDRAELEKLAETLDPWTRSPNQTQRQIAGAIDALLRKVDADANHV
jgi:hypothetical protein